MDFPHHSLNFKRNQIIMLSQNHQSMSMNICFLPFLSHGHMIPMVDVARLFAKLGANVTIITSSANATLFQNKIHRDTLSGRRIGFRVLHWPAVEVGLPPGAENLSTASPLDMWKIFQTFLALKPQIEQLLHSMQLDCIVADMFYPWTSDTAAELGIPRLSFRGSSYFALSAEQSIKLYNPHREVNSDTDSFSLPGLPDFIEMTRLQLPEYTIKPNSFGELLDHIGESEKKSYGLLMNSFYDLEGTYEENFNKVTGMKTWSIGPISLLVNNDTLDKEHRGEKPNIETSELLEWLNNKKLNSVLYISFGSMVKFKTNQITEIAHALEASGQDFIWVVQKNENQEASVVEFDGFPKGFKEKIKESKKGLIIKGWAPQLMILEHGSVGGFVTHCGWNSILESVSAGLPMITWPVFAEQFYNEKLLTDVLKIGVSVGSKLKWCNLSTEGLEVVKKEDIERAVGFLMSGGDEAAMMRKRARQMGDAAKRAVSGGGSSAKSLVSLFEELQMTKLNRAQLN